jgi:hypothetical protein
LKAGTPAALSKATACVVVIWKKMLAANMFAPAAFVMALQID